MADDITAGAAERETMRPEDVPQDLVLAAAWALADFPETDEGDGTDEVRVMLAAVLPLYGQQLRARAEVAEAALETLRGQIGKPRETGDERDRAVWCWTRNPHGRLHCGRLAGHDGPHKRGEREWHDTEDGGEPT